MITGDQMKKGSSHTDLTVSVSDDDADGKGREVSEIRNNKGEYEGRYQFFIQFLIYKRCTDHLSQ